MSFLGVDANRAGVAVDFCGDFVVLFFGDLHGCCCGGDVIIVLNAASLQKLLTCG